MIPVLPVSGSRVLITRVGFGCARLFGGNEFRASRRLLEAALDGGIRHFDTAPSYGGGLSEEVLGAVLAGVQGATISTKIGISRPHQVPGPFSGSVLYRRFARPIMTRFPHTKANLLQVFCRAGGAVASPAASSSRRSLTRDEVLYGLDDSLRRLRRDRVEIYLIHEPDQFDVTMELMELFTTLQMSGRIGAFGLAWGRVGDTGVGFGTVVQSRYDSNLSGYGIEGETRIFHGALRQPGIGPKELRGLPSAGTRMRIILDRHPDAGIIFSASSPAQIRSATQDMFYNSLLTRS